MSTKKLKLFFTISAIHIVISPILNIRPISPSRTALRKQFETFFLRKKYFLNVLNSIDFSVFCLSRNRDDQKIYLFYREKFSVCFGAQCECGMCVPLMQSRETIDYFVAFVPKTEPI